MVPDEADCDMMEDFENCDETATHSEAKDTPDVGNKPGFNVIKLFYFVTDMAVK